VQAACGIASIEGAAGVPGALPVQALDHATGYLLAGAMMRELAARESGDEAADVRLALAATAAELMRMPAPTDAETRPAECDRHRLTLDHPDGAISLIAPPGALDGVPLRWQRAGRPSPASWPRERSFS